jgi:hypothetical protein
MHVQWLSVGLCKMASFTPQDKVQCHYWLAEFKFTVNVQCKFHLKYGHDRLDRCTVVNWHKHLLQHGSFKWHSAGGRPWTTHEEVENIWEAFQWSPCMGVHLLSKLQLPGWTVCKQCSVALESAGNDFLWHCGFASDILSQIDNGNDYLKRVWFIDKATVHILNKVNNHNHHIWWTQNPCDVRKHEWIARNGTWCRLASAGVIRPFFFHGQTVTSVMNCDTTDTWWIYLSAR